MLRLDFENCRAIYMAYKKAPLYSGWKSKGSARLVEELENFCEALEYPKAFSESIREYFSSALKTGYLEEQELYNFIELQHPEAVKDFEDYYGHPWYLTPGENDE